MTRHRLLLPLGLVLLGGVASGCRTTGTPPPEPEIPGSLRWAETSAEYHAILEQTFRLAGERLVELARGREPGTWAVSIDADETLISNRPFQWSLQHHGGTYNPEVWSRWVEEMSAPALPGGREFLDRVRELGGRIVVVTNRREQDCPATRKNLEIESLPFDLVLCMLEGEPEKGERWQRVENGQAHESFPPLEIIMWVGDNIRDFPGLDQGFQSREAQLLDRFGDDWFVLPNPMYGSWSSNPVPTDPPPAY